MKLTEGEAPKYIQDGALLSRMTACLSLYIFVLCLQFFEFQMEVSTSNAEGEESCELYIPVAKKARLITLFNKCIICQNDRKEKLRTAKESSIKTLLAALERRCDETYRRLVTEKEYLQDKDNSIYWHSTCYSAYTSEQNLQYAEVQQGNFRNLVFN